MLYLSIYLQVSHCFNKNPVLDSALCLLVPEVISLLLALCGFDELRYKSTYSKQFIYKFVQITKYNSV